QEVNRIYNEMIKTMRQTGFNGTFKEFIHFLRTDERFYAKTEQELLQITRSKCKEIDTHIPKFFKKIPSCPFAVEKVPDEISATQPIGYYFPSDTQCTRPGVFYINTYDVKSRPIYLIPSFSLHE